LGYQIQAIFKITMHKKDNNLLYQVKDFFGVGSVTKHGENTSQYTVKSLKGRWLARLRCAALHSAAHRKNNSFI